MPFTELEKGKLSLIMQDENGNIKQLGITTEQSDMLQVFCASISKESQFVLMPEEYDLTLKK